MARRKQGEAGATRDAVLDAAESGFRLRAAPTPRWSRSRRRPAGRAARRAITSVAGRTAEAVLARGRLPLLQDLRRLALAPGPVVPARCWLARSAGWMRCRGDPHARNVFGILAWAYDYADDYAGIRRETLALGLREFRLLRALLRRAEAAGELRLGLDGHECARLLAPGGG